MVLNMIELLKDGMEGEAPLMLAITMSHAFQQSVLRVRVGLVRSDIKYLSSA